MWSEYKIISLLLFYLVTYQFKFPEVKVILEYILFKSELLIQVKGYVFQKPLFSK